MITEKEIVAIFDFDDTLFYSPESNDENREILRDKIGYTKSGWWGRPESLDLDFFDIPCNKNICKRQKDYKNSGAYTVMLTGRILKCANNVKKILATENLIFDDLQFTIGGSTLSFKIGVLNKILVDSPNLKEIHFYDDRTEHIPEFRKWGDSCQNSTGVKFRLFHVIGHDGANTYELKYKQKLR